MADEHSETYPPDTGNEPALIGAGSFASQLEAEGDHLDQISIVAFTNSRSEAPFGDVRPGHEMWSCNNAWLLPDIGTQIDEFHRWFDVHPENLLRGDEEQVEWLQSLDPGRMKVYLEREHDDIPAGVRLPIETMIPYYGPTYYTNTISYQLALAGILLRPALARWKQWHRDVENLAPDAMKPNAGHEPPQPTIGVYGVDMATDSEYGAQRPSCEFFLGVLMGAGYKVDIASSSLLLAGGELYGLQDDGRFRHQLLSRRGDAIAEIQQLQQDRANLTSQIEQISARVHFLEGTAAEVNFWLERWTMPEIDREANTKPNQI